MSDNKICKFTIWSLTPCIIAARGRCVSRSFLARFPRRRFRLPPRSKLCCLLRSNAIALAIRPPPSLRFQSAHAHHAFHSEHFFARSVCAHLFSFVVNPRLPFGSFALAQRSSFFFARPILLNERYKQKLCQTKKQMRFANTVYNLPLALALCACAWSNTSGMGMP